MKESKNYIRLDSKSQISGVRQTKNAALPQALSPKCECWTKCLCYYSIDRGILCTANGNTLHRIRMCLHILTLEPQDLKCG